MPIIKGGQLMYHILIVEDDHDIAQLIQTTLEQAGYAADVAHDGKTGANMVENRTYALALLDIMLPNIDGYELFSYIKEFSIPVIFITAKGTIADKTKGFHMGADDYLVKPFELEELILRVENVLRLHGMGSNIMRIKDIELDRQSHTVRRNGQTISLTPKEYELFELLARNKNIVLHRFALYEKIWGEDYDQDTRTLDIHIRRLRQKLGMKNEIKTVHKVGYMLEDNE